jgi:DNA-binding CsgD family transcriptional regulator
MGIPTEEPFLSTSEQAELWCFFKLSPREAEIVRLMLLNYSELQVSRQLKISTHTVHSHMERIYRKMHVHGRCELVVTLFKVYVSLRGARSRNKKLQGRGNRFSQRNEAPIVP